MNIFQRINEVRKIVPYIQKDAKVQGYRAVTHDAVTARLHDALVKQGIIVLASIVSAETIEGTTANGGRRVTYRGTYRVSLVNMDDPQDRIELDIEAHADDMSDKAPGKCLSYAVKLILLKVFSLETGENEEGRMESENRRAEFMAMFSDDNPALISVWRRMTPDERSGTFAGLTSPQKGKCRHLLQEGILDSPVGDTEKSVAYILEAIEADDVDKFREAFAEMSQEEQLAVYPYLDSKQRAFGRTASVARDGSPL